MTSAREIPRPDEKRERGASAAAELPRTFRRRRSAAVHALDLGVLLLALGFGPSLLVLALLVLLNGPPGWLGLLADLPTGSLPLAGSLAAMGVVSSLLGWGWERLQRRRYGACVVHPDGLWFERCARYGGADVHVCFDRLGERTVTPHGLLLQLRGETWFESLDSPLLVPCDEASATRLLGWLDDLLPPPDQATQIVLARAKGARQLIFGSLWGLAPFAMALIARAARGHDFTDDPVFWAALALSCYAISRLIAPLSRSVHGFVCLRASVLHGQRRLATNQVTFAAYEGGYLLLSGSGGWLLARVDAPPEAVRSALTWAGVRCPVADRLPEWAGADARRRRARRDVVIWLLLSVLSVALLLIF